MVAITFVLLLLAFVAFVVAAFNVPTGRISLVPLGLALWVLSMLVR